MDSPPVLLIRAMRLGLDSRAPDVVTVVGGGGKTSLVFRLAAEISGRGLRVVTATTTRVAVGQIDRAPSHIKVEGDTLPLERLAHLLDVHGHCMLVGGETLLKGKQTGIGPHLVDQLALQAARLNIAAILIEGDGSRTLPVKAPAEHEPVVADSTTLLASCLGLDAISARLDEEHAHRPERIGALLGLDDTSVRLSAALAARLLLDPQGGAKALPAHARFLPILNKADTTPRLAAGRLIAGLLAGKGVSSLVTALGRAETDPVVERWGPVAVVILAAGEGSRFRAQGPKQVALVEGETLVHRATRLALGSGAEHVIVVTGAHEAETRAALDDLRAAAERLTIVHNDVWAEGQSTSVRAGLAALPATVQAAIIMPVDQPWLNAALLRRLITTWRRGGDLVAPLVDGEVRGAPALFDRAFFGELTAGTGDSGGRLLLQRRRAAVTTIAVAASDLVDVDRPDDLVRHLAGHS